VTAIPDREGTGVSYDLTVFDEPEVTEGHARAGRPGPGAVATASPYAGTLSFAYGSPAAGTPIQVTRAAAGHAPVTLQKTATRTADGALTITDKPPRGTYTYTPATRAPRPVPRPRPPTV